MINIAKRKKAEGQHNDNDEMAVLFNAISGGKGKGKGGTGESDVSSYAPKSKGDSISSWGRKSLKAKKGGVYSLEHSSLESHPHGLHGLKEGKDYEVMRGPKPVTNPDGTPNKLGKYSRTSHVKPLTDEAASHISGKSKESSGVHDISHLYK